VGDRRRPAGIAGRHVHRGLGEPVGGPDGRGAEVEAGEALGEAAEGRGLDAFATAEDGVHTAEIEAGHVVVRRLARGQFEREIGGRRKSPRIVRQQLHPPGGPLQKRRRTCEHSVKSAQYRRAHSEHQTHVVIKRQPRHQREVRRCDAPAVGEIAGHQLREIRQHVLVGNDHTRRLTCRSRRVLQVGGVGETRAAVTIRFHRIVAVQRIDLDDRRGADARPRRNPPGDIVDGGGCRENCGGRGIAQHRIDAFVGGAPKGNGKRNRDDSGLQRAQKSHDVIEPLRRKQHGAVTG